ncbi:L-aspartate oxidase [Sinimarinibacterium sp. NLF-5-8]|uniref:L-aspartate oxidase n=1 Tax=Sinimarinibacterium sp. NLF-5-8 TaxID=2698684 RepID=UPI00137C0530|nr:L-aspartate oxidase [Sinimarinibacterium sp. NLF-5-8]QHS11454.1 L-aspartate oxidase [Sinimarinibacterium sp. NLF-5-8]
MISTDVLVIGSGAAGLSLALRLAQAGRKVCVVSKTRISSGSTLWAQGGISAVLDADDSLENHVQDTLIAGAGLCDEQAVRFTVARGPAVIRWLVDQGVEFTQVDDDEQQGHKLHLTREGGHSHRRIVHAADATGRAVETTLVGLAEQHPNITVLERRVAVDLILDRANKRVQGAYLYNRDSKHVEAVSARAVALCTGGANQVYLYSSNPFGASGDGIAMAWRAGCRVANMEFMQFHPTCLFHPEARNFLISEALRGEGALLRLPNADGSPGERFMPRFDARAELAPRDIVARAIDHEMKRLGLKHVLLDITHKDADFIRAHFPSIHARCLELGLGITEQAIPVVPSAHFTCGGILTDLSARTDVGGLYAIGEAACTGLHGANRLASNSLLECLAFASAAADDLLATLDDQPAPAALRPWDESRVTDSDEDVVVSHNWLELRTFMWDYVGIVRTSKRLERALRRVQLLNGEIHDYYGNYKINHHLLELRNLVVCAELIVRSALQRKESRGLHYMLDYPKTFTEARPTILTPGSDPAQTR